MTRISKKTLSDEVLNQISSTFVEVLSSLGKDKLGNFLQHFLTREEKTMLGKRLSLFLMIQSGYSDQEIKEALKVSYETIRQSRNHLDSIPEFSLKKLTKNKTSRLLKFLELAFNSKTNIKARAKLSSGNY